MADLIFPVRGGEPYPDGRLGFPDYPEDFLATNHPSGFGEIIDCGVGDDPISKAVGKARSDHNDEVKEIVKKINVRFQRFNQRAKLFPRLDPVLSWFVYWSNKKGLDDARRRLSSLLDHKTVRVRVSADLVGINYQHEELTVTAVGKTLTVENILNHPSRHSLVNYILYPHDDMHLGYYPTHCVSYVKDVSEQDLADFIAPKSGVRHVEEYRELLGKDRDVLDAFCMAATLNGHGQVSPDMINWFLEELPCYAVFEQPLVFQHVNVARTKGDGFGIEKIATQEIENDINMILNLDSNKRSRFDLALRQLSLAKGEASEEEKYLYSGSALEIILEAEKNQIAFSVRLFGAMVAGAKTGETGVDRKELYDNIKLIYDQRSKAIHGGRVDKKKLGKTISPDKIASDVIKEHLKLGMPKVDDYILGLGL